MDEEEQIRRLSNLIEDYIDIIRHDLYSSSERKKKYINKLLLIRGCINTGGLVSFAYDEAVKVKRKFRKSKRRRLRKKFDIMNFDW